MRTGTTCTCAPLHTPRLAGTACAPGALGVVVGPFECCSCWREAGAGCQGGPWPDEALQAGERRLGATAQEAWPEVLRCLSLWEALVQGRAGGPTDALLFSQPDKQPGSAKKKPQSLSSGFFGLARSHASDGAPAPLLQHQPGPVPGRCARCIPPGCSVRHGAAPLQGPCSPQPRVAATRERSQAPAAAGHANGKVSDSFSSMQGGAGGRHKGPHDGSVVVSEAVLSVIDAQELNRVYVRRQAPPAHRRLLHASTHPHKLGRQPSPGTGRCLEAAQPSCSLHGGTRLASGLAAAACCLHTRASPPPRHTRRSVGS